MIKGPSDSMAGHHVLRLAIGIENPLSDNEEIPAPIAGDEPVVLAGVEGRDVHPSPQERVTARGPVGLEPPHTGALET